MGGQNPNSFRVLFGRGEPLPGIILTMLQIIILCLVAATLVVVLSDKGAFPKLNFKKSRRIILDSCALIDGRIVELVKTGFVTDGLIVPKFILRELQKLADGNDSHKRERARFGLETAVTLQEITAVTIDDAAYANTLTTDDKLIILAKERHADLCTTDYNLNKVASVEGVRVLNVNELSQALRPVLLPGEEVTVKLVQKGSNQGQGVGYLDDGTMIVVEGGAKYIGKSVSVVMEHMLQTVAGKMSFARLKTAAIKPVEPAASSKPIARQPSAAKPDRLLQNRSRELPKLKRPGRQKPLSRDQLEASLIRRTSVR